MKRLFYKKAGDNMNNDKLIHYGIKGMRWGVRKKYSDKEISEYRKKKIAEAPTKSESPRGANKGWYKNAPKSTLIREMRREESESLKTKKKINTKKDSFVLKKGTSIHRSTYDPEDGKKEGHAFASFKTKDAKGYAFRNKLISGGKKTFDLSMVATEDLISPSKKERVDTFVKLMQNDPEFNKAYQTQKKMYQLLRNRDKADKIYKTVSELEKEYNMFSVSLGGSEELRKRYFSELNKKGYNMVIDDADASIIADSPIIVFDRQKSLEIVSVNEVNRDYLRQIGKN